MDSIAGDLQHAAKEVGTQGEKPTSDQPSHSALQEGDYSEKGPQILAGSSGSTSSEDAPHLEKLDSQIIKVSDVKQGEEAYAHLPDHEREIIKRQLDIPEVRVTFVSLYRYATRNDLIIVAISAVMAIAGGAVFPLLTIIFGQLTGVFQSFFQGNMSESEFRSQLSHFTLYFIYLAIGEWIAIYVCTVGFIYSGEHVTQKVREQYLAAIMRQNIAFFDNLGAGEITTRITADTNLVQSGISEKVGLTLTSVSTFVTAFVIAFIKYWKLTLILSSTMFAIVTVMAVGSTFIIKYKKQSLESYALGGSIAEEVISSIRNATAFSTQDKLARQYEYVFLSALSCPYPSDFSRKPIHVKFFFTIVLHSLLRAPAFDWKSY